MTTNKIIMKWYTKGFNDELKGTSTIMGCSRLLEEAYNLGAVDAIVGDDLSNSDAQTEKEIINRIKKM